MSAAMIMSAASASTGSSVMLWGEQVIRAASNGSLDLAWPPAEAPGGQALI
jgi:hypothetical protein